MSLLLFAIVFVQQTISIAVKQVDLTPTNTNQNDATITEGALTSNDVTVDSDNAEWDILVSANSQRGYHLEIDLNNAWGFHPNKESSISFTMNSSTIINQNDLNLLVSFSVNDDSYITYFLSLDTTHINNVHPAICDISTSPTQSLGTGDVKSCVDSLYCHSSNIRDCKATEGCKFNAILPNNYAASNFNSWPLTITMLNNPITNKLFTTISSPSWNGWTQGCGYGESFATNSGLQIYIGVDEAGQSISFHNFHIEYSYDTTQHPTKNPTANPTGITATISPTTKAPITSTALPTTAPSKQPTNMPSKQPTNYPSKQLTNVPSKQPTDNPTTQPTNNSSTQSTSNQSAEPSEVPSTNNPTATPTTKQPTTTAPTTTAPTTQSPTTQSPTTKQPTTTAPTTKSPTTTATTTKQSTTQSPTTTAPTTQSSTTKTPTTKSPTTTAPTTQSPTTSMPTTSMPTTANPTTANPTTSKPTTLTLMPTTKQPTTQSLTTQVPTTKSPTTKYPTTKHPTTTAPTTKSPITTAPTTKSPSAPSTQSPTTKYPTTTAPTTASTKPKTTRTSVSITAISTTSPPTDIASTASTTTSTTSNTVSSTANCDNNDEWYYTDCTDPDGPNQGSILFTDSLKVCTLDGRFKRNIIWKLFKLTYKAIIITDIHISTINSECSIEIINFYVENYVVTDINGRNNGNGKQSSSYDCSEICDNTQYSYSIQIEIALFCQYDNTLQSIYDIIKEEITNNNFNNLLKNKILGFSIDEDTICNKGFGAVQIQSASIKLRDKNRNDISVKNIYSDHSNQYKIFINISFIFAIIFFIFYHPF